MAQCIWVNGKLISITVLEFYFKVIVLPEYIYFLYNFYYGTLDDGNRYEGFFENGLKEGEGLFYHNKTGQIQKGIWEKNICRTSIMQDEFRQQAPNPTEYPIINVIKYLFFISYFS